MPEVVEVDTEIGHTVADELQAAPLIPALFGLLFCAGWMIVATVLVQHALPRVVESIPRVCLLYTSPSPRDGLLSRMPSSA